MEGMLSQFTTARDHLAKLRAEAPWLFTTSGAPRSPKVTANTTTATATATAAASTVTASTAAAAAPSEAVDRIAALRTTAALRRDSDQQQDPDETARAAVAAAVAAGGAAAVVTLFKSGESTLATWQLTWRALRALRTLTADSAAEKEIAVAAGAVAATAAAMAMRTGSSSGSSSSSGDSSGDEHVQLAGIKALGALAFGSDEVRDTMGVHGGIAAVIAAMRAWPANSELQGQVRDSTVAYCSVVYACA
jgi:hypothetical protein